MAHVLIITSEMAGRINIVARLAGLLEDAGHGVTIGAPSDISDRLSAHGRTHVLLDVGTSTAAPSPWPWRRRRAAVDAMDPGRLRDRIAAIGADLVLVDVELPVHLMAACATGAIVAAWTSMMSGWKRRGLPPLHTDIVPGRDGWRGSRAGIQLRWLRFRVGRWLGHQRKRIEQRGADRISRLRGVAHRMGFRFRREAMLYQWTAPLTYRTLPVVIFNALELELPHVPRTNAHYVGPMIDRDRERHSQDRGAFDEAMASIGERRNAGEVTTVMYAAFGSWHGGDDTDFLQRLIEAVSSRPDWEMVLGLGDRLEPEALEPLPPNVHAIAWAPQMEALASADVAIHHAGVSSLNEAVVSGVPMVAYPFRFLDQPGNAARIAFHGLGVIGDRAHDSPIDITRRIAQVIDDPRHRAAVARMRERCTGYGDGSAALAAIERLLDASR
jgi:zeaxanthin glucosyltransferase